MGSDACWVQALVAPPDSRSELLAPSLPLCWGGEAALRPAHLPQGQAARTGEKEKGQLIPLHTCSSGGKPGPSQERQGGVYENVGECMCASGEECGGRQTLRPSVPPCLVLWGLLGACSLEGDEVTEGERKGSQGGRVTPQTTWEALWAGEAEARAQLAPHAPTWPHGCPSPCPASHQRV